MPMALLIIDMINDFVHGKFGFPGARDVLPRIAAIATAARKRRLPVIYICDAHRPGDPEISIWGEHAMEGTEGSRIVKELSPGPDDLVLTKNTYDAFFETPLNKILREKGVDQVILTGVVTDICIQNTAAGAFFRGYKLVVPEDCVSSPNLKRHLDSLAYMREIYGAKIVKSEGFSKFLTYQFFRDR
jgi:nicotinamidase-related amidase